MDCAGGLLGMCSGTVPLHSWLLWQVLLLANKVDLTEKSHAEGVGEVAHALTARPHQHPTVPVIDAAL